MYYDLLRKKRTRRYSGAASLETLADPNMFQDAVGCVATLYRAWNSDIQISTIGVPPLFMARSALSALEPTSLLEKAFDLPLESRHAAL